MPAPNRSPPASHCAVSARSQALRNSSDQLMGELDQASEEPGHGRYEYDDNRHQLRDKRQSVLMHLKCGLQYAAKESRDDRSSQQRPRQQKAKPKGLARQVECGFGAHGQAKLSNSVCTIKCQPST